MQITIVSFLSTRAVVVSLDNYVVISIFVLCSFNRENRDPYSALRELNPVDYPRGNMQHIIRLNCTDPQ